MNATRNHKITIVNGGQADVAGPVDFIRLHESTGTLIVDIGGMQTSMNEGNFIRLRAGSIDGFVVKNESGSDVTATFKLGDKADFEDSNLAGNVTIDKSTSSGDIVDTVIANNATVNIAANAARRSITVYAHPDNSDILRVGPNAGAGRGRVLNPGMELTFDTTSAIKIFNDGTGVDQTYGYYEESD